jgi:hypothetical protein
MTQRAPVATPSVTNQATNELYKVAPTLPWPPAPPANSAILLEAEAEAAEEVEFKASVVDGLLLDVELSSSADNVSSGGSLVADSGVGNNAVAVMSSTDDCASALLEA